jgi:hypothetical protein
MIDVIFAPVLQLTSCYIHVYITVISFHIQSYFIVRNQIINRKKNDDKLWLDCSDDLI